MRNPPSNSSAVPTVACDGLTAPPADATFFTTTELSNFASPFTSPNISRAPRAGFSRTSTCTSNHSLATEAGDCARADDSCAAIAAAPSAIAIAAQTAVLMGFLVVRAAAQLKQTAGCRTLYT